MNLSGTYEDAVLFDPHATVPRDTLWDPTASILSAIDPDDPTPGPSKPPAHANPSETVKDEHVVPAVANFLTFEAGNDYNEDNEPAATIQTDQSDILSALIWEILQRGPEQSNNDGPDEVGSELLEKSMDYAAVVLHEADEDFMQTEGGEATVDPEERPAAIFQQFAGDMDADTFYFPY